MQVGVFFLAKKKKVKPYLVSHVRLKEISSIISKVKEAAKTSFKHSIL